MVVIKSAASGLQERAGRTPETILAALPVASSTADVVRITVAAIAGRSPRATGHAETTASTFGGAEKVRGATESTVPPMSDIPEATLGTLETTVSTPETVGGTVETGNIPPPHAADTLETAGSTPELTQGTAPLPGELIIQKPESQKPERDRGVDESGKHGGAARWQQVRHEHYPPRQFMHSCLLQRW